MLQSLNHLTLAVSDLQKSVTFWHELLGLALHARWNTGAYLTCGDLWVCLSFDEARQHVPPQESDSVEERRVGEECSAGRPPAS